MIPGSVIDAVQDRTNIVEIISQFVDLKKAGRSFKGRCVFHEEKTPSFVVSPEKQIFHCFGCHESGNVFSFLMKHKQMSFRDAVKELADRANIEIPESAGETARKTQKAEYVDVLKAAEEFYTNHLRRAGEKTLIRKYLEKRGLTEDALSKFGIGYAPDGWDALCLAASKRFSQETLEKAGLVLRKQGGGYYDRFRNRMMFPIRDTRGSVVGFGARALDNSLPKYINSPESDIYHKGRNLYGLHYSLDSIRRVDRVILVEGYMDVIACHQAGVENVVSASGTALTPDQARLIKRFTRNVTVLFDSDQAGQMAALRGLDLLLEEDCDVCIAVLTEGHDPDSFVRAFGPNAFKDSILGGAQSLFDFKYGCLAKKYPSSVLEDKIKIAMEMLDTIRRIPNAVLKASLVKRLADEMRFSEEALLTELLKKGTGLKSRQAVVPVLPVKDVPVIERMLIGLFLTVPSFIERAKETMTPNHILHEGARRVVELIFEEEDVDRIQPSRFLNRIQDDKEAATLVAKAVSEVEHLEDSEKAFTDCINRIETIGRQAQLQMITQEIRSAELSGDRQKVADLLGEFSKAHHGKKSVTR